jgi:hypothetical protein
MIHVKLRMHECLWMFDFLCLQVWFMVNSAIFASLPLVLSHPYFIWHEFVLVMNIVLGQYMFICKLFFFVISKTQSHFILFWHVLYYTDTSVLLLSWIMSSSFYTKYYCIWGIITYLWHIYNLGTLQTFHNSTHHTSQIFRSPKEVSGGVSRSFFPPRFLPTVFYKPAYGEA